MMDEFHKGSWFSMKKKHGWGYLNGNAKTLSDWVYLRPDVELARQRDHLSTNEIYSKGIKNVHYFYDREEACQYFKSCFTLRGVHVSTLPGRQHRQDLQAIAVEQLDERAIASVDVHCVDRDN